MPLSRDPKKRSKQLANRRDAPPAPKGNRRAVKHGARATPPAKRVAALTAEIAAALPVRDGDGGPPIHDLHVVGLMAVTLARLESVTAYVDRLGPLARGKLREAAVYEDRLVVRAANLADRLGMTPRSRAALGLDLARTQVDLATLLSDDATPRATRPPDIEGSVSDD
jgi:hypothetical protein